MEQPQQPQQVNVVHKGLFYHLFKLIALPFKLVGFIFKFFIKYIKIYFGWYKDYKASTARQKRINQIFDNNRMNEEVI